ncbi:MAG: DUF342 domain-containing protein [Lentisphaerae bacterium]|nr:DUF342 domain-containing protein [Lentisphaerota bacterium]
MSMNENAPGKPSADAATSAELTVDVLQEGLHAFVVLPPQYAGTPDDVMAFLQTNGVVFGADASALESGIAAARSSATPTRFLAATGRSAVNAEDGRIDLKFAANTQVDAEGDARIDFHESNRIILVKKDQLLAELFHPVDAIEGKSVQGKAIPPTKRRGALVRLVPGKNIRVEENRYYANCDGMVTFAGREIQVLEQYTVDGDVDLSVGNIRFTGSVLVKGSVRAGFIVEAGQDIEIRGEVADAKIVSGGNITVTQGLVGTGKNELRAKGNLSAGFIENSFVECEGDVIVRSHIMQSKINAEGWVKVVKGKGAIIGGEVRAGKGVEVRVIGSDSVRGTLVAVSGGMLLDKKLLELDQQLAQAGQVMKKIHVAIGDKVLKIMLADPKQMEKLPAAKRPAFEKLIEQYRTLESQTRDMQDQKAKLMVQIENQPKGEIRALELVYPGSIINIGRLQQHVQRETGRTLFIGDFKEGEIRTLPL